MFKEGMLPVGTMLSNGKYRIERYLASGGFGNTYVATDTAFDEQVAIKELYIKGVCGRGAADCEVSVSLSENMHTFTSQRDKFKKEARRLRKLTSSHIVHVHDLFDDFGTSYYVMDFIDGESLSSRIKRTKTPLTEAEVLHILPQLLDALEVVHAEGIWHLDLKPANIMQSADGNVQLIDFGASKQLRSKEGYSLSTSSALAYTPGYASSEQMEQNIDKFGPYTDLYSLGATLFNLLTLRQPPSPSDIDDDPDEALPMPEGLSKKTRELILWLMKPSRKKRPQTVAEVKQYLAGGSAQQSAPAPVPVPAAAPMAPPPPPVPNNMAPKSEPAKEVQDVVDKDSRPLPPVTKEEKEEKPADVRPSADVEDAEDESTRIAGQTSAVNTPTDQTVVIDPRTEVKPAPVKPQPAPQVKVVKPSPEKKSGNKMFVIIAIAVALVIVIGGAIGLAITKLSPGPISEPDDIYVEPADTAVVEGVTDEPITITTGPESKRKFKYTGEVDADNLPSGEGEARYEDGDKCTYNGKFDKGEMHDSGKATLKFDKGDKYEGSFEHGYYKEGRYTLADKSYFEGTFKDGVPYDGKWYNADGTESSEVKHGKEI